MYEYKFVKLDSKGLVFTKIEDYREIINKHASEGWRLVQILPVKYGNGGYPKDFEMIFEKNTEK